MSIIPWIPLCLLVGVMIWAGVELEDKSAPIRFVAAFALFAASLYASVWWGPRWADPRNDPVDWSKMSTCCTNCTVLTPAQRAKLPPYAIQNANRLDGLDARCESADLPQPYSH